MWEGNLNRKGTRRSLIHDYKGRCIYMLTLKQGKETSPFSVLADNPPRVIATETGRIIEETIGELSDYYPVLKVLGSVIMPDHIHMVVFITSQSSIHLGKIVSCLKNKCRMKAGISLFEGEYNDRILLREGQLERMLRYVEDNPRRRLERIANRDLHHRSVVYDDEGQSYEVYGNIAILDDFNIEAVRISRSFSPEYLRSLKQRWLDTVLNGGVLVSAFISESERKVFDWAAANGGRFIHVINNDFGRIYSPKEPWHTLCTQGRALIISAGNKPFTSSKLTREDCMLMNAMAERIAAGKIKAKKRN